MTNDQKQKLFNVIVACVLGVFAVFGFTLSNKPAPDPVVVGTQSIQNAIDTKALIVRTTSDLRGDVTAGGNVTVVGTVSAAAVVSSTNPTYTNITTTANIVDGGTLAVTGASALAGAVTVGGGFGDTGCSLSAAGVLQCNGAATIGGAAVITGALTQVGASAFTGDIVAATVYVNGYLRSSNGPVTAFDPLTALKEFTATKGIIVNGRTFTESAPITITGVLSNVRLLYYQVP